MPRSKSLTFGFSAFSFALLLVVGLAAPDLARAQAEGLEQLQVSPSRLDFGRVALGATSPSQTETVTSEFTDDNVTPLVAFISLGFVVTGNTCTGSLAPFQSCQVDIACKPIFSGLNIGAYVLFPESSEIAGSPDGDDGVPYVIVPLTCIGVPGASSTPTASPTPSATATANTTATVTATATP